MNKKLWMSLGTAVVAASSVVAVVSCGSSKSVDKASTPAKTGTNTGTDQVAPTQQVVTTHPTTNTVSHTSHTSGVSSLASDDVKQITGLPAIAELQGDSEYDVVDFKDAQSLASLKASNIKNTDLTRYDAKDGFTPETNFNLKQFPFLEGEHQLHVEKSKLMDEAFARKYNAEMSKAEWIKMYSESKLPVGVVDAYQSAAWHTTFSELSGTKGRDGIGFRFTELDAPARFESESQQGQEATWATETNPRIVANPQYDKVKVQVLELKQIVELFSVAKAEATKTWTTESAKTYIDTSYGIAKAAAAKIAQGTLDSNPNKDIVVQNTPVITYLNFNGHLVDLESLRNSFFNVKGYFANQKIDTLEQLIWNINTFMEITFVHPIVEGLQNITEAGNHDKGSVIAAYGHPGSFADIHAPKVSTVDATGKTVLTSPIVTSPSLHYIETLPEQVSDIEFANNPVSAETIQQDIMNSTRAKRLTYGNAFEGGSIGAWKEIIKATHGASADLSHVWNPVENKMENGKLIRRDDFHAIRNYETNIDNKFQLGSGVSDPAVVKKDSTWFRIAKPWKLPMFWDANSDKNKYPTFEAAKGKKHIEQASSKEVQDAAKLLELNQKYENEKLFDFHGSRWSLDITEVKIDETSKQIFKSGDKNFFFDQGTAEVPSKIGAFGNLNLGAFLNTVKFEDIKAFFESNTKQGRTHFVLTNQLSDPAHQYDIDGVSGNNAAMLLGWIPFSDQNRIVTPVSTLKWEEMEANKEYLTRREQEFAKNFAGYDVVHTDGTVDHYPANPYFSPAQWEITKASLIKNGNDGLKMTGGTELANMQVVQHDIAGGQVYSTFYLEARK